MVYYIYEIPFRYGPCLITEKDLEEIESIEYDNGEIRRRFTLKYSDKIIFEQIKKVEIFDEQSWIAAGCPSGKFMFEAGSSKLLWIYY